MDFDKLSPWNWFKKEEEEGGPATPLQRASEHPSRPRSLLDMQKEFDRFFDALRHGLSDGWPSFGAENVLNPAWFKPSLDIASDENAYSIKIELPGIDAGDVAIEIAGSTMRIRGEKRQESEEREKSYYRIERSYGSFQRILDLPDDADAQNISSGYKDGVLSITIPKKTGQKREPKKIEINVT